MGAIELNLARARVALAEEKRIHALFQFDAAPNLASRRNLAATGVRILGYLPENAFFVSIPKSINADVLKRTGVAWVGAIYPEDKLPPRMQASGVGLWALRADGTADLRIRYYGDVSPDYAALGLANLGASVLEVNEELDQATVNVSLDQIAALAACDWVRWIEEVPPPPAPYNDGARTNAQADPVQTVPYDLSGAGVVLGIWDAGSVDPTHEDFAGRLVLAETNAGVHFHSTHVAGTMAGSGQRSLAAGGTDRQWRGIAPGSSIVSYTFNVPIPKHDEAINVHHVVLSQNSWGIRISPLLGTCSLFGEYSHLAPDYDRVATGLYGKPINVLFAAGNLRAMQPPESCNTGPYRTVGPPATAKDVIAVGAINSDDNSMAFFSSWGPVGDGRLKPDLVAPGAEVGNDHGVTSTLPGNVYGTLVGTSMATPVASGAIALLVEDYRAHYNGQDPPPSTMKGLLVHTAGDLDDETSWYNKGPDFASGYGRVQIKNAVEQLRQQGFLVGLIADRATNQYLLQVPEGTSAVKLTLVWDDPAAMENAAIALVNDLDLIVLDPQGQRFYPWTLDPANPSAPASQDREDHLNVIEQVLADADPASGDWTVQVVGKNIPVSPPQKYTLLFTPATIPVPPVIVMEQTAFSDADSETANNNGFIDPGETIAETIVLRNAAGPAASNVTATIQADVPDIELLQASSVYPDLATGVAATNDTPFAYRVPKTLACGASITFTCVASANGFLFTNTFMRVVGQFTVTNVVTNVYESVDVPQSIPDGGSVISTLEITNIDKVAHIDVSLRIDHEWVGDVEAGLEHPDGTTVRLIPPTGNDGTNFGAGDCGPTGLRTLLSDSATEPITSGSAPFVGSFQPDQPLAALNGKPIQGTWSLGVSDVALQDTGTLLCWGMTVTRNEEGHVCSLFNRPPGVSDQVVTPIFGVATNLALAGSDPDNDPITFAIESQPAHGALTDFDAFAGTVTYTPEAGYNGPDAFTYVVSDGYTNSLTATVHLTILPMQADLSLSAVAPEVVVLGSNVTVTVVVTNDGPSDASGVILSNTVPEGLSVVSAAVSQGAVTNEGSVVRGELGELAAGSSATLTLVLRADQLGIWTNAAEVTAGEFDPKLANNTIAVATEVKLDADLVVALRAAPDPVLVQGLLTYTIDLTNQGPHTATAVRLIDVLPETVNWVSLETSQGSGTNENGTVRCELGGLAAGSNAQVRVVVQCTALGLLTNEVSVSAEEIDLEPADNVAETVVRVAPAVELSVMQQQGAAAVLLGQPLTLVMSVSNAGPSEASGVRLEDALPAGLNFVSVQTSQGSGTNNNGVVRCELGVLAMGSNATVTLEAVPGLVGLVTNTVEVSASETDLEPTNNTATLVVAVEPAADLAVGQEATPDPVRLGGELTYEVVVTNLGPSDASGVRLEDVLPEAVNFISVETSQGSGTNENGTVRCELGELAAGSNATVRIVVETTALGALTNVASVLGTEADAELTNNTVSVVSAVRLDADLVLSGSVAPELALVDQELTYTLVVSNQGPNEATEVRLEDVLPEGLSLVPVQNPAVVITNGGIVRVELGTLTSGATAAVSLVVVPHHPGTITNQANVTSDTVDMIPENNAVTLVTTIQPLADFLLQQQASAPLALVNDQLAFSIRVTPIAPYAVPQTLLTDNLPDSVDFVSASATHGSCTNEFGSVVCDFGEVPEGETATVAITVVPRVLGEITNQVVLNSPYADPASTNLTSQLAVTVVDTPALRSERSQNKLLLSWPLAAENFILQVADNLIPPVNWSEERNAPVIVGDQVTVTVKMSTQARYYRLVRP